jgi:hypothetical protein
MAAGSELLNEQQTASGRERTGDAEAVYTPAETEKNLSLFRRNVEMAIEWAHLGGD